MNERRRAPPMADGAKAAASTPWNVSLCWKSDTEALPHQTLDAFDIWL